MRLLLVLALCLGPACSSSDPEIDDLSTSPDQRVATLALGERCQDGIGEKLGQCATGLVCCRISCPPQQPDAGTCLDLPSECQQALPTMQACN